MRTFKQFLGEEEKFREKWRLEREYVDAHENDVDIAAHGFKRKYAYSGTDEYLSDDAYVAELKTRLIIQHKMWKFVKWFSEACDVSTNNAYIALYDGANGLYKFELTLSGAKVMRDAEFTIDMLQKYASKKWDEFVPEIEVKDIQPWKVSQKRIVLGGEIRARTKEARNVMLRPANPDHDDENIANWLSNYRHSRQQSWRSELRSKFEREYEGA